MTTSFRRYIAFDVLALTIMNSVFNASYVSWLWNSPSALHLTGSDGIAFDLAGTPVWIAALTTLLGTAPVQRKLWDGRFREPAFAIPAVFRLLPGSILMRATVTGLLTAVALAIPLWLILQHVPVEQLTWQHAVITKVALTALFTVCIGPLVVLAAIADMRPPRGLSVV